MADLSDLLPSFDLKPWRHLTYSLEKKKISTTELITLDPIEIARKCPLPLKEVRRMSLAVRLAIKDQQIRHCLEAPRPLKTVASNQNDQPADAVQLGGLAAPLQFVTTLDHELDRSLGGGFPVGKICEIAGQSAVGKTQLVLSLLLSAQLSRPRGLGRKALYISTEGVLNTKRLVQMLESHPEYSKSDIKDRPTLDQVLTMTVHDMDTQDRLINYRLNDFVVAQNIGLIVIDSITANYRVAYQGSSPQVLSDRSKSLNRTATALRNIAHHHRVAVVVTNQVSDRFDDEKALRDKLQASQRCLAVPDSTKSKPICSQFQKSPYLQQGGPIPSTQSGHDGSTPALRVVSISQSDMNPKMALDFQQRFCTGWGDDPTTSSFASLKTPALGHSWTNHLDGRFVLKVQERNVQSSSDSGYIWSDTIRQRHLHIVFAPWIPPNGNDIEYTLQMHGLESVSDKSDPPAEIEYDGEDEWIDTKNSTLDPANEHAELLDPKYWEDTDDEFP